LGPADDPVRHLLACFEQENADSRQIRAALGEVVRVRRGMRQLARDTGLSRDALYHAVSSEGEPKFDTVLQMMRALGLKLHAERMPD
jgi:probable addiction module antidote protein